MPVTSLSVDSELLSATSIQAADEARDLRHVATPFITEQERVHGAGSPNKGSGFKWVQGMGTGEHSQPTRRRTGYEQLDLSVTGVLTPLVLTPGEVVYPILISATEEDLNGGEDQIIELAAKRTSQVVSRAKRDFDKHMVQGGVAKYEDIGTLNGVDNVTTGGNVGYLEEDAVGSQANTVGGFSKTTWAALPGAQNQAYDIADSFNSNGLPGLFQTITKAKVRVDTDLSGLVVLASEKGIENYKRTIQTNERYTSEGDLDATNLSLLINSVRAMTETHMPNAGTNTTGNPVTFYLVDMNALYFMWSNVKRDGYFGMSPFEEVGGDYDVLVAKVLVRGQLWIESWGGSALLHSGETF